MATVAQLAIELDRRAALILDDAGLYQGADGELLRPLHEAALAGLAAVVVAPHQADRVTDDDLAGLSSWAYERVKDEAERFLLNRALLNWHRVLRDKDNVPAQAKVEDTAGGYRAAEKAAIRERIADLNLALAAPYREPGPALVVAPDEPATTTWRPTTGWGWCP